MDDKALRKLAGAFGKANPEKAYGILDRLKTDEEFMVCVTSCRDEGVVCAAVDRILDPTILMMIAQTWELSRPDIAHRAGKRIVSCFQDPQLLTKIIFDKQMPECVKTEAFNRIDDLNCLAFLSLQHPDSFRRIKAVDKLLKSAPDHPAFWQLLVTEKDAKAAKHLVEIVASNFPEKLFDIALDNPNSDTRCAAAKIFIDYAGFQKIAEIRRLAKDSPDEQTRLRATSYIERYERLKAEEEKAQSEIRRRDETRAFINRTEDVRTLLDYAQQSGDEMRAEFAFNKLFDMPQGDVAAAMNERDIVFVNETIRRLFDCYRTRLAELLRCIYKRGLFTEQIAAYKGRFTYQDVHRDECNNYRTEESKPFYL